MGPSGGSKGAHVFALASGTMLHEFELVSVLGHGGFGITYLARDTNLDCQVAIKEYLPNDIAVRISDQTVRPKSDGDQVYFETGIEGFLTEARALAQFRHPNVVHVRRFFRHNGTGYIVQDYEPGKTLGERQTNGPIAEIELRKILYGILEGLAKIHNQAMLHRDIKPSNILLREDGTPVLIDFGAARDFGSRDSRYMTAMGTEGYSPPEQRGVPGRQGPWTDLYALGATAYQCVTGEPPLDALMRLRNDRLVPARNAAKGEYSLPLLDAIDWMLKVDESERPLSVEALRDSLADPNPLESPRTASPLGDVLEMKRIDGGVRFRRRKDGATEVEFDRPVQADILDIAFFIDPPKRYLIHAGGRSVEFGDIPHYWSIHRIEAAGKSVFEINSDLDKHIPPGAQVTLSSRDAYINATVHWPQATGLARRWLYFAAVVVIVVLTGGYFIFRHFQENERQQADEQQAKSVVEQAKSVPEQNEIKLKGQKRKAGLRVEPSDVDETPAQKSRSAGEDKAAKSVRTTIEPPPKSYMPFNPGSAGKADSLVPYERAPPAGFTVR